MTRFQIEQVQAVIDLAEARLRNPPLDPNVEHDLREIARLARLALGASSPSIDCKHLNAVRREDGWHCSGCGLVGNLTLRDGDWVVAAPSSEGGQR